MARLVTSADFEQVLRSASRARTPHFAVHHLLVEMEGVAATVHDGFAEQLSTEAILAGALLVDDLPKRRLGVVVPKRHARRAVTRTLLKRQIYAAGDRFAPTLDAGMWVVRLRAPFDKAAFPSAASAALKLVARTELDDLFRAAARPVARRVGS